MATGPLTEVVVIREDAMCDRCTVSIVVKGVSRSRFSLVASLKDTPLALRSVQHYSHSFKSTCAFPV